MTYRELCQFIEDYNLAEDQKPDVAADWFLAMFEASQDYDSMNQREYAELLIAGVVPIRNRRDQIMDDIINLAEDCDGDEALVKKAIMEFFRH